MKPQGTTGIVLREADERIQRGAKEHGYASIVSGDYSHAFARALIVEPGTGVPWHLVPVGLHFVEAWDAAAPLLWAVLARDIGNGREHDQTQALTLDLRVPLYACELLFVRKGAVTDELLRLWIAERDGGAPSRLAFLRAFYRVKPMLCALPSMWVGAGGIDSHGRRSQRIRANLVRVEFAPGKFVQCHPGEEDAVVAQYRKLLFRRRDR